MRRLIIGVLLLLPLALFAQKEGQKYVEVCGIKWATGNLYCANGKWGTATKQWYRDGLNRNMNPNCIYYFNFGESTPTHDSGAYYYNSKEKTICGTRFDAATHNLGSEWRLPTKSEFDKLLKEADICWGKYYWDENSFLTGIYFSNPKDKKRHKNKKDIVILTDEDMENGLFLPACGHRGTQSQWIYGSDSKVATIFSIKYWTGDLYSGSAYYLGTSDYPNAMLKVWFTDDRDTPNKGLPIRPVYLGAD